MNNSSVDPGAGSSHRTIFSLGFAGSCGGVASCLAAKAIWPESTPIWYVTV